MWCFVSLFLVFNTSAVNYLERLVSEMTYYESSGTLNSTHSLTLSVCLLCFWCMWCFVSLFLVFNSSAVDCLERLVAKMTYYVSSGTLNPTHSLTHSFCLSFVFLVYVVFCFLVFGFQ